MHIKATAREPWKVATYLLDEHPLVWRVGEEFRQLEVACSLGSLSQSTTRSIKKYPVKASR